MSGKKRKGVSPWSSCDHCNAIIAQKYRMDHKERGCPPDLQNWTHPFISNETLYTCFSVFELNDESLQLIAKEDRKDFVLLPFHVLQLCKIPIGEFVSVKVIGGEKSIEFVKTAWSKEERTSDFDLDLSAEVSELYNVEPKSPVIVSKIFEKVSLAKSVTLLCDDSSICSSNSVIFLSRLQKQNLNKIYCVSNKIILRHYGSRVVFEIVEMTSFSENKNGNFCIITPETVWRLKEDEEKKMKCGDSIRKLGGLDSTISELKDIISLALSQNKENFLSGIHITRGILIHGPSGTGKTTLLGALPQHFSINVVQVECTKILSRFLGETEEELQNLFDKAKQTTPSVIVIDDLDVLCAKSNSITEFEKRIVASLSTLMDKLNPGVVVLAATSKIHQIDKMLRSPSRFGKEVEIYVPSSPQRYEILKLLLGDINHSLDDVDVKRMADFSHGFVGGDLVSLVSKAVLKNYKRSQGGEVVSLCDFEWALGKVKPSAMREIMLDVPNVGWDDIGGQEELKLKLRQCVEWPLKYRDSFVRLGIAPPKGVLMFGPPGCSKTMIAKALATESKLNFISVKGPELFSKWVGESERAVRKVFRRARQSAPSIIFFDELDAMGGERNNSSGSNVQERVLAQLLTELDGVESLDNVIVIAATNRPDRIDAALIRPGRLDRIVYVPLPDRNTRREILRLQLTKSSVGDDVVVDELVDRTEGYSGAEIVAVTREAGLKALEENINAEIVTRKHFMEALAVVLPRTPKTLLTLYDKYSLK